MLSDSVTVAKLAIGSLSGSVTTAPTTVAEGAFAASVTVASGSTPTGTVTVTLIKGDTVVTVSGSLVDGAAAITLPNLPAGSWSVELAYSGDSIYNGSSTPGGSVEVVAPAPPPAPAPTTTTTTTTSTTTSKSTTAAATTEVESEDEEGDGAPSPEPSPEPEVTEEPSPEPESSGDGVEVQEEVLAASGPVGSEPLPTRVLALGGLIGVGLIGYVGFQLLQGLRTRP